MRKSDTIIGTGLLLLSIFMLVQCKSTQNNKVEKPTTAPSANGAIATDLAQVVRLADAFKATLSAEQLAIVQLPYSKTDAVKWSNFPQGATRPKRVGIGFGTLNSTQLSAAKALMGLVLSNGTANEGYDEMEGIMAADDYFGKTLGKSAMFGAGNYYLAFLGTPSTTGLWELQFGGHHFAFANTYNGGKLTGVTPSFRGVEPIVPIKTENRTYQSMSDEQQTFTELINSLSGEERTAAKLSSTFSDVILGPGKDGQFPESKQGVKVGDLSAAKQKLVANAIALYVADLDAITAKTVMAGYTSDLANTYFSYAGSGTMNQNNDYVRIDGPSLWIEYSAQPSRDFPGTTHPHSVWRDRKTDYGSN